MLLFFLSAYNKGMFKNLFSRIYFFMFAGLKDHKELRRAKIRFQVASLIKGKPILSREVLNETLIHEYLKRKHELKTGKSKNKIFSEILNQIVDSNFSCPETLD